MTMFKNQVSVNPTCHQCPATQIASLTTYISTFHVELLFNGVTGKKNKKNIVFCFYCEAQRELCKKWIRILLINLFFVAPVCFSSCSIKSKNSMKIKHVLSQAVHACISHFQHVAYPNHLFMTPEICLCIKCKRNSSVTECLSYAAYHQQIRLGIH